MYTGNKSFCELRPIMTTYKDSRMKVGRKLDPQNTCQALSQIVSAKITQALPKPSPNKFKHRFSPKGTGVDTNSPRQFFNPILPGIISCFC